MPRIARLAPRERHLMRQLGVGAERGSKLVGPRPRHGALEPRAALPSPQRPPFSRETPRPTPRFRRLEQPQLRRSAPKARWPSPRAPRCAAPGGKGARGRAPPSIWPLSSQKPCREMAWRSLRDSESSLVAEATSSSAAAAASCASGRLSLPSAADT